MLVVGCWLLLLLSFVCCCCRLCVVVFAMCCYCRLCVVVCCCCWVLLGVVVCGCVWLCVVVYGCVLRLCVVVVCVRALVSSALQCCFMFLFFDTGVEILASAPERRWALRTSPKKKQKLPAFCRAGWAGRKRWSFQHVPPSRPEPKATVHTCTVRALTQDAVSSGYGVLVYARLCPLLCSAVSCSFSSTRG